MFNEISDEVRRQLHRMHTQIAEGPDKVKPSVYSD